MKLSFIFLSVLLIYFVLMINGIHICFVICIYLVTPSFIICYFISGRTQKSCNAVCQHLDIPICNEYHDKFCCIYKCDKFCGHFQVNTIEELSSCKSKCEEKCTTSLSQTTICKEICTNISSDVKGRLEIDQNVNYF